VAEKAAMMQTTRKIRKRSAYFITSPNSARPRRIPNAV
jgi:hypothetical protein